jgi:hypothetical protein
MVEDRILAMECVSEGGRSWVHISLESGLSSANPDTIEGRKHNLATVPYLEYYYPKYSRDGRCKWDNQILVEQETALPSDPGSSNGEYKKSGQETG